MGNHKGLPLSSIDVGAILYGCPYVKSSIDVGAILYGCPYIKSK
jgi:coenzyme F420-reducing hydrogenase gamma subunit